MKLLVRLLSALLVCLLSFLCGACIETANYYLPLGLPLPLPKDINVPDALVWGYLGESAPSTDAKEQVSETPIVQENASVETVSSPLSESAKADAVAQVMFKTYYRWNAPNIEERWKKITKAATRLSTERRMRGDAELAQAEGLLEAFGKRYMPNAFNRYQTVRAKALETEHVLQEHFPQGQISDPTGGELYAKVSTKCATMIAEMFRRHDELCFFFLLHEAGIFSDILLAKYDKQDAAVWLADESIAWPDDTPELEGGLSPDGATFASKYMPETFHAYQRLLAMFEKGTTQYRELRQLTLQLDAARVRCELYPFQSRLSTLQWQLETLHASFLKLRMTYLVGEIGAGDLAKQDSKMAEKILSLEKELDPKKYYINNAKAGYLRGLNQELVWCPPGYFKTGGHWVTITNGFWIGKYEWADEEGYPNMGSWDEFTRDLKESSKLLHMDLRLPTEAEWEYACRAGSTGKIAGTGIMNEMGWYRGNRGNAPLKYPDNRFRPGYSQSMWGGVHQVGQKHPNAWGIYDMHGNAPEWCSDRDQYGDAVLRGGNSHSREEECWSSARETKDCGAIGDAGYCLRLCISNTMER